MRVGGAVPPGCHQMGDGRIEGSKGLLSQAEKWGCCPPHRGGPSSRAVSISFRHSVQLPGESKPLGPHCSLFFLASRPAAYGGAAQPPPLWLVPPAEPKLPA